MIAACSTVAWRGEVHVLLAHRRQAGPGDGGGDEVQPRTGGDEHAAVASARRRRASSTVGPQRAGGRAAVGRVHEAAGGARAAAAPHEPAAGGTRLGRWSSIAVTVTPGREGEERPLAAAQDADDLDVVALGEPAGEVERGADRAAHAPGVLSRRRWTVGGRGARRAAARKACRRAQQAHRRPTAQQLQAGGRPASSAAMVAPTSPERRLSATAGRRPRGPAILRGDVRHRLLVVEDDADLRSVLRRGLSEEGFAVTAVADGAARWPRPAADPDALVIDIGLPDADGRDVCQALRARGVERAGALPHRARRADRPAVGLQRGRRRLPHQAVRTSPSWSRGCARCCGAPGPTRRVAVGERPAARPRGARGPPRRRARCADADRVPPARGAGGARRARCCGARARRARPGREGAIVHDNTLDQYVARLRRKLRAARAPRSAIATVHGVGYRLG